MNKTLRNLLILFASIFTIKAIISFFYSGTYFYSDEACIVIKAKHIAEAFSLLPCKEIAHAPGGDPHPLFSIVISPIFYFFKGFSAYIAVLILNSLLISSLVFPLYWIIRNFIKKDRIIFLIIAVTLFLPHITIYEKTVLTESLFVVLNIWLLCFYGKYKTLKKNNKKYLILTILFAILAGFERPFGFIVSLALIINEIITSKKRLKILLILTPVFLTIIFATLLILGNVGTIFERFLKIFTNYHYFILGITALKNQINSLTVATLFIPIIIFAGNFKDKSVDFFKKTKWYILILIILNIGISANHIYGYLYTNNITDLITRYINVSIILLMLFSFIFLFKTKKFILNIPNTIITLLAMVALVFFNSQTVKHSLNLDLSLFYEMKGVSSGNLLSQNRLMEFFFFPIIISLFSLLVFEKRKLLIPIFLSIFFIWGSYLYYWNMEYSKGQNTSKEENVLLRDTEYNLLVLQPEGTRMVYFLIWNLKTLTNNHADIQYLDAYKGQYSKIDFYAPPLQEKLSKYDFIISPSILNLPIKNSFKSKMKMYYPPQGKDYEENIEILKSENKEFILNNSNSESDSPAVSDSNPKDNTNTNETE